jgi:hypothetical protein
MKEISLLHLGLPSDVFPSGFHITAPYALLFSLMLATSYKN